MPKRMGFMVLWSCRNRSFSAFTNCRNANSNVISLFVWPPLHIFLTLANREMFSFALISRYSFLSACVFFFFFFFFFFCLFCYTVGTWLTILCYIFVMDLTLIKFFFDFAVCRRWPILGAGLANDGARFAMWWGDRATSVVKPLCIGFVGLCIRGLNRFTPTFLGVISWKTLIITRDPRK